MATNPRRHTKQSGTPERRLRVRVKRLDQVDEQKLALAYWMLARAIVEDRTLDEDDADSQDSRPSEPTP